MPKFRTMFLATAAILTAAVVQADPVKQHNSNAVWFENWTGLHNATLNVSEPSGLTVRIYAEKGTPVYKLSGEVKDGVYRYELTAATDKKAEIIEVLNNGREKQPSSRQVQYYGTGHFTVYRGAIVPDEKLPKEEEG